jgi:ketosteroid isomerase-like protein
MKFLIAFCATLAAATIATQSAGPPAAVPTSAPGSPEAELVSLTNEWTSAILAKDRAKLEALMSPEFTLQGWDGSWQVERPQWLENTVESYDIAEYHHANIVPHVYGDVAAITSKWYWRGKRGRDEKKPFEEHGYCVDMWRHANGRWKVVSRLTIIMPGKEEPGSKHD